ncbi:3'-5' exonuclease domain-containing protein [Heracleum sosnowskyi]|uniref:3'-5' exonuclease domain-containing protein n=1 Tax=Heracleum sosnowskyi TaxID=360622 RepID=A0AAD8GTT0_9APIA|nr:3'-5' exonuclease domain-containing protein [Heracleum sosnowskyi]
MEYSSSKHLVSYCGQLIETTVTNNAYVVDHWIGTFLRNPKNGERIIIVGLDCKFKRHSIPSLSNKIATLQLCIDTKCLVLQLVHMDSMPHSLTNLLDDKRVTFFGVRVDAYALNLSRDYGLKFCKKIVDIRDLAKIWFPISYLKECSLKAIAYEVAGLSTRRRKKKCGLDWEAQVLDVELTEYASVDAYALYKIAHTMFCDNFA